VTDIRRKLDHADGTHVFTGIYCVRPEFTSLLPDNEKISIIPAFLDLAQQGLLGAVVMDEGVWLDLGDRQSYLEAHFTLHLAAAIHPDAVIHEGAVIENSVVGPGGIVESGAIVRNSVVWPGGRVSASADLDGCIVCSGRSVEGIHRDEDL
jgi:NDP-sugar pyrophosphorylase family protein